jgi:hypothetical protein
MKRRFADYVSQVLLMQEATLAKPDRRVIADVQHPPDRAAEKGKKVMQGVYHRKNQEMSSARQSCKE